MANIAEAERGPGSTQRYQGGLAATLVRTLLIFTFIPLILMGGAAYLRARTLLRDQVVRQMQAQLTDQLGQVDLSAKTKEIRLDRIVRRSDFESAVNTMLHNKSGSPFFLQASQTIQGTFSELNREGAKDAKILKFKRLVGFSNFS